MIINRLTLENFKSHRNTKIEFKENISLILGSNGAGKSSILEAISYALFKEFNGTIDNLIRKSADENEVIKKMQVTVEFNHDGKEYLLKRGKTKSTNIAELKCKENDTYFLKCRGDREVNNEIINILDLDTKSFLNAVYIRQGDITDLIEKRASERKELIAKLLNIESFEIAWNEIKNLIKIYEDEKKINDRELEKKETIEEEIKRIEETISNNSDKLKEIKPETQRLGETVKSLEAEVTKLKVDKTKHESLTESLKLHENLLNKNTEQKKKNEEKLKEIEKYEENIKELEKEVQSLEALEELKELKNQLDNNNEKIRQVNKDIIQVNNNVKLKDENKEYHDKLTSITEEIAELNNKRKKLNEEYTKYNAIKAQIEEKRSNREKIKEELQKSSEKATEIFGEYFTNPKSIEDKVKEETEKTQYFIEDLTKNINKNENRISVKENELNTTRKSLTELEHTEDTCPICQSEISHEKHEELSAKYKDNILNYELEIESLKLSNKNQTQNLNQRETYLKQIESIRIDVLKSKNEEFINLGNEIESLKSNIPQKFMDDELLNEVNTTIEEKEKTSNELKEKDKTYLLAVQRLNESENIEELTGKLGELTNISNDYKSKCQEIMIKYAVKDNLNLQIKHLRKQNDILNELKGKVQNKEDILNNIKNMADEISGYGETIKNTKKEIEELNYDDENYKNKEETYRQNLEKYDENRTNITKIETEIRKDQENIKSKNNELKELEEIEIKQQNLSDYIKTLNTIRDIYSKDGVQKTLRENVRPLIEQETLNIFNEFDFDYTGITLDSDYNIQIHNKKEDLDLTMISGGEKIVIALALRLGIAQALSKNKTNLLILDEPTIHLDEDRRSRLIDIIRQINFVPQMIVVTHDEEMEPVSNNIIKITKHNGISSIEE